MKVLIADDHSLILEGMRRALEGEENLEVVGQARSGEEVLALLQRTRPNMVLMDVRMPGMDGLACLDLIRKRHPDVKVVLISASADPSQVQEALRRGASAYIAKTVNAMDLGSVLRQASDGSVWSAPAASNANGDMAAEPSGLTVREISILQAMARGLSNKAISREFWVTEQTVKFHLTNIYRKLGVPNRTAAAQYAHQHGLLEQPAGASYSTSSQL